MAGIWYEWILVSFAAIILFSCPVSADWTKDIIDSDSDNDGVPDVEDDMAEDSDTPGDIDYGIPDWHPKSRHRS